MPSSEYVSPEMIPRMTKFLGISIPTMGKTNPVSIGPRLQVAVFGESRLGVCIGKAGNARASSVLVVWRDDRGDRSNSSGVGT